MPKEYIERSKVVELIKNYGKGAISDGLKTLDPVDDIIALVKGVDLIPAADVVEVVRCKDCAYFYVEKQDEDFPFCCLHHSGPIGTSPNHFCGYGKRKGGAE